MAVGFRIDWPHDQSIDANSSVRSGAKFQVDLNGTTTPQTLYSDRAVTTTRANPVEADSAGNFPVVYVATDSLLTLSLSSSADVAIDSWNDQEPVPNVDDANLANYLPLVGGTMAGAIRYKAGSDITVGSTINGDASGGNINLITGAGSTITGITLAEGAERIFVFDGVNTLTNSSTLALGGADLATHDGMVLRFKGEAAGVVRLIGGMTGTGKALRESAEIMLALGDETTAITTGNAKVSIRAPFAMTLDQTPRASLVTASSSGNPTFDINIAGTSIFDTQKLQIDQNEATSTTAGATPTLTTTTIADDALITVDIDTAGTNAAGAKILLRGWRACL